MARHNSVNYSTDGGFTYADAGGDLVEPSDIQGVGKSFEFHTHDNNGRGVAIGAVVAGTHAARPAAGHEGAVYWSYDTGTVSFDDGSAWQDCVMLNAAQTLTGKTLTSPVLNGATLSSPSTDKLSITGPASLATLLEAGVISASGAPTTGTWQQYTVGYDEAGVGWFCTAGGTPGTWVRLGPSLPVSVANGGTGVSSIDAGGVLIGQGGGSSVISVDPGANGALCANGSGANPSFRNITGSDIASATITGGNIAPGSIGGSNLTLGPITAVQNGSFGNQTVLSDIPGCGLTLPAGKWLLSGQAAFSTGTTSTGCSLVIRDSGHVTTYGAGRAYVISSFAGAVVGITPVEVTLGTQTSVVLSGAFDSVGSGGCSITLSANGVSPATYLTAVQVG